LLGIEQIKAILSDEKAIFNREIQGVVTGDAHQLYPIPAIERFLRNPKHEFKHDPRVAWSFIDPSGGGTGSDYVIATRAKEDGKNVVSVIGVCNGFSPVPRTGHTTLHKYPLDFVAFFRLLHALE
jgi:hypothetical protein